MPAFNIEEEKPEAKKPDKAHRTINRATEKLNTWLEQHTSAFMLIMLLVFSLPLYLLFRHSPVIPDLRLSECFVAMVYIANMLIIYNIVPSLLCFSTANEIIYCLLSLLLVIIPIKQLTGHSYPSTIWRLAVALIPFTITALLMLFIAIVGIAVYIRFFG